MSTVLGPLSREEFDARVAPHLHCLLRCARRVLPSDDLAWDAVAETLARLWRRGFVPTDARAALTGLVMRASLHERRRLTRRNHHEHAAREARCFDELRHCRDPYCEAEQHEFERALKDAIEALPPRLASVLRLRAINQLEYDEIAARLAIPVGTVRSRLHQARARMRATFGDDSDDSIELEREQRH